MQGIFLYPVDGSQTDPTFWHIDNPAHRQIIPPIFYGTKISQQILDLPSGIKVYSAYHLIRNVRGDKALLKHTGLCVSSIENSTILVGSPLLLDLFLDRCRNIIRLVICIIKLLTGNLFPLRIFCPECLVLPPYIVMNHRIGRIQNIGSRTIILLQFDDRRIWKLTFKIQNILNIGSPELVDGLVVVPHDTQIPILGRQNPDQMELYCIRVLILVHHNIAKPLLVVIQHIRLSLKQLYCPHQKVIKIQSIVRPKLLFVFQIYFSNLLFGEITLRLQ